MRTTTSYALRAARQVMEPLERVTLADAKDGELIFAQVREDPLIEMQALAPALGGTIVIVSSAGCTSLSLLAAGARRVVAVDSSRTQNHLVELKCAAVRALDAPSAIAFLGGQPMPALRRRRLYGVMAPMLTDPARAYWDGRAREIEGGVLHAGRSERFIAVVAAVVRHLVVRRYGVARLLVADSLDEQRKIFARDWSGWRWKALFALLLNRWSFSRAYDPSFFEHVENPSFARHFRTLAERALTEIPSGDNYFLHEMLSRQYPVDEPNGVPPYLTPRGVTRVSDAARKMSLVDGSVTEYLRSCSPRSIQGFALSNIAEWLDTRGIDELFEEIARTASPDARVVFRNFVGWTEIPERWKRVIVECRGYGERLIARDRSMVQRRVVVCDVRREAA
jgi:S-adenosylmethionine-diacylglycerol 3-amino-3-carboxypropyl transferase